MGEDNYQPGEYGLGGTGPGMSDADLGSSILRLRLDGPQITLPRLREFMAVIGDLLQEVAAEVPDAGPNSLRWLLEDARTGSFEVALRAEPAKQKVRYATTLRVVEALSSGLRDIQQRVERPAFFTDPALEQAKKLVELIGDGITGVTVSTHGAEPIQLTRQLAANVEQLAGPELSAIGTIEGRIETLTIHARQFFSLYDAVTGRRYECLFGRRISLEDVTSAFGKRVAVRGIIRQRQGRDGPRIEVTNLRVFPAEQDLPSADDVRGILRKRPQS
jgi:hypothetical protein